MTLGQKVVKAVFCLGVEDKRRTLRLRNECRDKDEKERTLKRYHKNTIYISRFSFVFRNSWSLLKGSEYITIDSGYIRGILSMVLVWTCLFWENPNMVNIKMIISWHWCLWIHIIVPIAKHKKSNFRGK